jgi:hypothetical protein
MNNDNAPGAGWRKATYSNGQGSCVEVGNVPSRILIRDTTQECMGSARTVLSTTPSAWQAFAASLK